MADNYRKNVNSNDFDGGTTNWDLALAANQSLYLSFDTPTLSVGLNQSAIDFKDIIFQNGARVPIDDGGSGLRFDCNQANTGRVLDFGYADKVLSPGVMFRMDAAPSSPTRYTLAAGTTKRLSVSLLADYTVAAGAVLHNTDAEVVNSGGTLRIEYNATAEALVVAVSGETWVRRGTTELQVGGDAVVYIDLSAGGTIGTLRMLGGRVVHLEGQITTNKHYAGTYDRSKLRKKSTTTLYEVHPGAQEILEGGDVKVAFTTRTEFGRGPRRVQP